MKDPLYAEYARTAPLLDLKFSINLADASLLDTPARPALIALALLATDIEAGKVPQARQRKLVDAARYTYRVAVHNLTVTQNTDAQFWAWARKQTPERLGSRSGGGTRTPSTLELKRQTEAEALAS